MTLYASTIIPSHLHQSDVIFRPEVISLVVCYYLKSLNHKEGNLFIKVLKFMKKYSYQELQQVADRAGHIRVSAVAQYKDLKKGPSHES